MPNVVLFFELSSESPCMSTYGFFGHSVLRIGNDNLGATLSQRVPVSGY